ncbi:MAG TPA: YjgN family protein, partial [Methylotenera sp.]|nr:YjgN family protein [Methylotenera sp.]
MENSNQTLTPIVFQGKASEYFGIWIVNLLLTLLTLGIYSAWAKVRRKKYFYNNTLIQNVGFDYHAKPTAILKGRIIAFVFFVGYSMSANVHPILPALFMLILFTALPWLVVRGSLFNAHNTSHRGLRFDFVGTLRGATRVYIVLPLVTLLTFGLGAPYAAHERKQFSVNNHKFGLSPFVMQPRVKEFYKVYLKLMLIPILIIAILAAIAIP